MFARSAKDQKHPGAKISLVAKYELLRGSYCAQDIARDKGKKTPRSRLWHRTKGVQISLVAEYKVLAPKYKICRLTDRSLMRMLPLLFHVASAARARQRRSKKAPRGPGRACHTIQMVAGQLSRPRSRLRQSTNKAPRSRLWQSTK